MPQLHNKKVLNYDLELLYEIIIDVENYSKFIPWCKKVSILEKRERGFITEVEVEFLFIKEKYISIAEFSPPKDSKARAEVKMLEGPFHHFETIWDLSIFSGNPKMTLVDFFCDFSFNNKIYDNLAKVVLKSANNKILESFMMRAKYLLLERDKNML
jgi:coenzyme Q-binding protein COQ10